MEDFLVGNIGSWEEATLDSSQNMANQIQVLKSLCGQTLGGL